MATRPVFIARADGPHPVEVVQVEFAWHAGMARSQRQKSVGSLHDAFRRMRPGNRILEVSSLSVVPLGVRLSAFNLTLRHEGRDTPVECVFQAAKRFENGGPFTDLLTAAPRDAKRDPRLQTSGRLTGFSLAGQDWGLSPLTAFYDWLYLGALAARPDLARAVMDYDSFTDIAFNPARSVNCQARAVALYVGLQRRGALKGALASRESYLTLLVGSVDAGARDDGPQASFPF